jgi:hypothetical protein
MSDSESDSVRIRQIYMLGIVMTVSLSSLIAKNSPPLFVTRSKVHLLGFIWGVTVVACLSASVQAAPSNADVAAHAKALEKQLAGQGYTIVVEGPFVIVGDEAPKRVAARVGFIKWVVTLVEKDFFAKQPDHIIDIWLFRNLQTYTRGAKKFFDDEPTTPYGYYSPSDRALIMNIGPGAGTLSHELVHPYVAANFPNAPSWFNEGLASLYEQPSEKDGHMWGKTNWRLPALQKMIRRKSLPALSTLMATSRDEFYDAEYDSYAYARFLCQYLQDHGKLIKFYQLFSANAEDTTGQKALENVVEMSIESFQPVFAQWALGLKR